VGVVAFASTNPAPGDLQDQRQLEPRGPSSRPGSHRERRRGRGGRRAGLEGAFLPVPKDEWPVASTLVARPGATTLDLNVLANEDVRGRIEYWLEREDRFTSIKTPEQRFKSGIPAVVQLKGLRRDAAYRYRFAFFDSDRSEWTAGPEYGFHTQRAPGSAFTIEIQGDSHPERTHQHDPALYAQTLRAAAADRPDFYICIGDDFSVDTLRDVTPEAVDRIYLGQRRYLGLVGHSAALFLVNGNHEQAALCNLDGTADNVAVWGQNCRERYFSQPGPEGIYTGDAQRVEHIGLLRDYYAFTWGDALFVVIDPYWHSKVAVDGEKGGGKGKRDLWDVTLGDDQYRWLKQTLEQSRSKYKFVFTHHVLGTGRGGIERAESFEWGGRNGRGVWEFERRRPGWDLPIHQLMAKNGVTIFFQGHDHVFCKQELDGVIYQTLPEPADPTYTLYYPEAYRKGEKLPNSGRVRVRVAPDKLIVEYVRSYLPQDVTATQKDNETVYRYEIKPPVSNGKSAVRP